MKVEFQAIKKNYGAFTAVHNLDLTIETGSLHFLLGPSGCGKTTTLRMLAGLEQATSGRILFDGKDVTHLPASARGIGMVFQNYALWPHMTVKKNVEYGLKLKKLPKTEIQDRINHVLDMTQLTRFSGRLPGQLSGGQQQRVALARALAIEPAVLLLDEPLSNLDAKLRYEMRDNIVNIHEKTGVTMVYVTHDQKEALSMASNITIMHSGHLVQTGKPRDVYVHPLSAFVAGFIGETNIVEGSLLERDEDHALIACALGQLKVKSKLGPLQVGAPVKISIRPEAIQILKQPQNASSENHFQGEVRRMTYLGDSEQLLIKVGQDLLKINFFNVGDHENRPGKIVSLRVNPEDIVVVPFNDEIGPGT